MKRALWVFAVVLGAGCVDLQQGRPYRCASTEECSDDWVCLKDGYCHARDVGVAVPCDGPAGCTGGWLCGQEGRCLDPAKPSAFPCDTDSQCVGGWRCTSERRCLDVSLEPAGLPFARVGGGALISPLSEAGGDFVRTSQAVTLPFDGGAYTALSAAVRYGTDIELSSLVMGERDGVQGFTVGRFRFALGFEAVDLALTPRHLVVHTPTGTLLMLGSAEDDGGQGVAPVALLPGMTPVDRLAPLAWALSDGGTQGAVVVFANGQAALVLAPDDVRPFGGTVLDVTATETEEGDAGLPRFYVLREEATGYPVTRELLGEEKPTPLLVIPRGGVATVDYGTPARLRAENGSIAASFTPDGIVASNPVRRLCGLLQSCTVFAPSAPVKCPGGSEVPDFGLVASVDGGAVAPFVACDIDGQQELLSMEGSTPEFLDAREADAFWGTSRGHVRLLPEGQLQWFLGSPLDEVGDLLSKRPREVLVSGATRRALVDDDFYEAPDAGDFGLMLRVRFGSSPWSYTGFVENDADEFVHRNGVVTAELADGGTDFDFYLPTGGPFDAPHAKIVERPQGRVLIVTQGDTLFAAPELANGTALVNPVLRPTGLPITDWEVRVAPDAGLEGWAVSNDRLFQLSSSTAERWRSTELPLTGRFPLGVWFSGASAQVGTTTGEVLALPSRVPVAPSLGEELTSIEGRCGSVFATTETAVWQLGPGDGGVLGAWEPLALRPLYLPKLLTSGDAVFVTDEDGVVLELPVVCR